VARAAGEIRGLKAILMTSDLVVLIVSWFPVLLLGLDDRRPAESLSVAAVAIGGSLFIMRYEGLYLSRLCAVRSIEVRLLARSTVYTGLGLVLIDRMVFVHLDTVIRLKEVGLGCASMLILLILERSVFRSVLRSARQSGARAREVLIVGSGAHAARLVSVIGDHPDYGMRVIGLVGDRDAATANGLGQLWMGTIDDTIEVALRTAVTGVVLSASASEHPEITTMVKRLQRRQIHVQVSNGLAGFDVQRLRQLHLAHEPMIYLEASRPRRIDFVAKRVIDLSICGLALLVLSPILIVASLSIKLTDRGPVLFKQVRVGRNGKLFSVYKFRTMVVNAEQLKADLMAGNERSGPLFKMDVDPRVTRIGRFLRLTSLDEVPQLLNVVRGQMSIVGPRPALPSEVIEFDEELRRRELVKPGITGLWQVEARDSPSFDAYRRLDLFYVDNWTVVGDLEIMMDTGEHLLGRVVGQFRKKHSEPVPTLDATTPIDASSIRVREQHSTV
jgi:exopolysaccharide biosynthesis polyprenyl glycosylphosphotransferase